MEAEWAFDDPSSSAFDRLPSVPNSSMDLGNWSALGNFTRLVVAAAPEITNFTLNMLDLGVGLATEVSNLSVATTPLPAYAIANSSSLAHTNSRHESPPMAEQVPEHVMDHAPSCRAPDC